MNRTLSATMTIKMNPTAPCFEYKPTDEVVKKLQECYLAVQEVTYVKKQVILSSLVCLINTIWLILKKILKIAK